MEETSVRQGKAAGIIFAGLNIILVILCAVLYLGTDRKAPEITFQASDAVYREGEENMELLAGTAAYDSTDGDITDRIVIEKIIEDRNAGSAVVYYAVSDYSGNVAKASRVFDAVYQKEEEESERFPEAGFEAEISLHDSVREIRKDEGTEGEPEKIDEQKEAGKSGRETEETPAQEETPAPAGTSVPTETPVPSKTPVPADPVPEPARAPAPTIDPSVPVLTLKVSEVKVKSGQGPAWVDLIGVLSDDRDNYETLFRNLSVSKYDKDKAGTYAVSVHTEDSDGNKSQSVPLTIIVE
ncbi:MAG: hypothetical protein NC429_06160 [Lachnospiraceae bacterium]|nr:hypothetical protein [Lachnospiraceae bacterium]